MPEPGTGTIGLPQGEMYRGDKIGNYEVLTQLSVGGMAELFLCFTRGAGEFRKFVVVKRILPDVKSNESYVRMFYDEARITSVLHHPNIAQVLDLGGQGEAAYIAMEFIQGQNLNQVSAACLKRKRLIPLGLSVSVCRDVCHALHYAHTVKDAQGREFPIIHRDVAQKNIMVTYEGGVKLLDFGIAKAHGSLGRTTAGMVKGTTGYMSPEQVRGEPLDGRSDVFCLGVVLFELLTGKRLFAADTETEEMERILAAPIPRPDSLQRKIPSALVELVLKALERDRNLRFVSARAMGKALEEVGGKWMYDADKRAALMQELFSARIEATRKLLESAGKPEHTEDTRKAAGTLTEDVGAIFPELQIADTDPEFFPEDAGLDQPPPGPTSTAPPAPPPAKPLAPAPAEAVRAPSTPLGASSRPPWRKWPLVAVGGLLVAGPVLFFLLRSTELAAAAAPTQPLPSPSPDQPIFVVRPAQPAAHPLPTPPPAAPEGALSLTTTPRARILRGKEVLGESPLTEVPLPAGKHRLLLVPPSGSARRLEVRIEAGKTTRLVNVRLASLPRASRPR